MSGKLGRPPEDRLLRQREIFDAVAPLLETVGARRLTMRQAAAAACLSLGGLCHYFPTKRELVLHGLRLEAMERICHDFFAAYGHLEAADPRRFLDAFVDFHIREVFFVRPSLHAAVELGADSFRSGVEVAMTRGLDKFVEVLGRVTPMPEQRDLPKLARAIRRAMFAALLDRTVTPQELGEELRALIAGDLVGVKQAADESAGIERRVAGPTVA